MTTWILILTLYADVTYSKGAAIGSVGGFDSQAACISAANDWKRRMVNGNAREAIAFCVPSSINR